MSVIESAVSWAEGVAADNSHGYDQAKRWGPDYDCSSLVISAYRQAGLALSCTYTGNMKADLLVHGFEDVTGDVGLSTGGGLRRGDVLLNIVHHTALYAGDGKLVQAGINEKGAVSGGQSGDQTGGEIAVRPYYNFPWDCVLRYAAEAAAEPQESADAPAPVCAVTIPELSTGSTGGAVLALQTLLIHRWAVSCGSSGADGDFGPATRAAVLRFQSAEGLETDGAVGADTWAALIG